MSKYVKYVCSIFVIALMIGAIESTPAKAGIPLPTPTLPPNHEQLAEVCLCFGRFFNGFNATAPQPSGRCARSQVGPFCFVDTGLMPIFWKQQVICEEVVGVLAVVGPTRIPYQKVIPTVNITAKILASVLNQSH